MPPRFTREELETYRGRSVPDLVGEHPRLIFVGINPGLWTAATQTHFSHPSNRFYPALRLAGLIDWEVDTAKGMTDVDRARFTSRGLGITNLVNRATMRASELTTEELRAGSEEVLARARRWSPRVLAFAGVTAYRAAFGSPDAVVGPQTTNESLAMWVVPNPSGLNAHETLESLAVWYRRVGEAAGCVPKADPV